MPVGKPSVKTVAAAPEDTSVKIDISSREIFVKSGASKMSRKIMLLRYLEPRSHLSLSYTRRKID